MGARLAIMTPVRVTLIGKPGCHLCADARAVVSRVAAALTDESRGRQRLSVQVDELDILTDEELAKIHSEFIPVVLINGKRHAMWHVDERKLTEAVEKAARKWRVWNSLVSTKETE